MYELCLAVPDLRFASLCSEVYPIAKFGSVVNWSRVVWDSTAILGQVVRC